MSVRIASGPLPFPDGEKIAEAAEAAVRELSALAVSHVKKVLLSGRDPRGYVGRRDTGQAHAAVGATQPIRTATGVRSVVAIGPPRDEIAAVLEDGRRPGQRPPPPKVLIPWIRHKLRDAIASELKGARVSAKAADVFRRKAAAIVKHGGSTKGLHAKVTGVSKARLEKAIESLAFVLSRSIGRRGFPGLHPFEQARALVQSRAEAVYARHLARVLGE